MSTWAARYVRLGADRREGDIARLRDRLGANLTTEAGAVFAMIPHANPTLQPDDLAALAAEFGEALSIQAQTVADLVVYDHFTAGQRTRGFTHAGEAGWVRVVGEPEAWEAAHFFTTAHLDELLEELESDLDDPATLERESDELKRLWSAGRLKEGSNLPHVELTTLTRALTAHFGLPHPPRLSVAKPKI